VRSAELKAIFVVAHRHSIRATTGELPQGKWTRDIATAELGQDKATTTK
jgi:hypothetical protein